MPSLKKLNSFYHRLSHLLESGLHLRGILRQIGAGEMASFGRTVNELADAVEDGDGLAEAMVKQGSTFPELHIRLIQAGEASGQLPATLLRLVAVLDAKLATRRTLIAGMIYPAILFHLAILLPNVRYLVTDGPVGYLMAVLPGLGILWGIVIGGWLLLQASQLVAARRIFDRIALRIPVLGGIILRTDVSDSAMALGALYAAGVPVKEGLEAAARIPRNIVIRSAFHRAKERVDAGNTLAEAFAFETVLPELFRDMVASGEASGQLDDSLEKVRDALAAEAKHRTDMAARLAPVAVYLLAALVIGWVVVSFFMDYFAKIDEVANW